MPQDDTTIPRGARAPSYANTQQALSVPTLRGRGRVGAPLVPWHRQKLPSHSRSTGAQSSPDLVQTGMVLGARIMALSLLAICVVTLLVRPAFFGVADMPPRAAAWLQLGLVGYFFAIGFGLPRLRLSLPALQRLDAILTLLSGVGFVLLSRSVPDLPPEGRELIFLVTIAHVLMIRAGVVPSSGMRTLWVSIGAILPGVLSVVIDRWQQSTGLYAAVLDFGIRSGTTIFAATLASRRIYGLERQVAQARRLGQYTLEERIGKGGMGVVYKASHALLRRPTAIKLVRSDDAGEKTLIQFEREVQLTSQLTHANTIQIYDFGRDESGTFYYAMEYLEGLTLHDLIELEGPQSPARAIALMTQICGSLAEAHAVGLVHRDIKPANIMICERGRVADVVKVLDFGLVKWRDQTPSSVQSGFASVVGTPGYIAPEAVLAPHSVDGRTDVYAVGAVGYFLVTGRPVFEAPTLLAVLDQHLHAAPIRPSIRLGAPVSSDFEAVLASCLSKDVAARPQSIEELGRRLLACRDAHGWSQVEATQWWDARREEIRGRQQRRAAQASSEGVLDAPVPGNGWVAGDSAGALSRQVS